MRSTFLSKIVVMSALLLAFLASPASADNETFTPDPPVAGPVTITSTNPWNGCPEGTTSWAYEHTVSVFPAAGGSAIAQYVTIDTSGTGSAAQTLTGSDTQTLPAGEYAYRFTSLITCDGKIAVRDGAPVQFTVAKEAIVPVADPLVGLGLLLGLGALFAGLGRIRNQFST